MLTFLVLLVSITWLLSANKTMAQTNGSLTYSEIKPQLLGEKMFTHIYGVPLKQTGDQKDTIAILLSRAPDKAGIGQQCTKRILHLPRTEIHSVTKVAGALCNGQQVKKFALRKGAAVVEELYNPYPSSPPDSLNLTVFECLRLGGLVKINFVCKTGVMCETHIEDDADHEACIDEELAPLPGPDDD
jgi:hypothetical protein